MMRIGRLRRRVVIQQPTTAADSYGGETVTFGTLATVWAGVEALRGAENLVASQVQAGAEIRVLIRYRSDIRPGMRVLTDLNETLEIVSLTPDDRRRELALGCRAVVR